MQLTDILVVVPRLNNDITDELPVNDEELLMRTIAVKGAVYVESVNNATIDDVREMLENGVIMADPGRGKEMTAQDVNLIAYTVYLGMAPTDREQYRNTDLCYHRMNDEFQASYEPRHARNHVCIIPGVLLDRTIKFVHNILAHCQGWTEEYCQRYTLEHRAADPAMRSQLVDMFDWFMIRMEEGLHDFAFATRPGICNDNVIWNEEGTAFYLKKSLDIMIKLWRMTAMDMIHSLNLEVFHNMAYAKVYRRNIITPKSIVGDWQNTNNC